jgi:hypothetical protein
VATVLARIPVLLVGVAGSDTFGGYVDPVDDQVVPAGLGCQVDHLGQRQCPPREDLDAFLDQGAAGAFRDTVALTQLPVGVSAFQPCEGQDRLCAGVVCPPAGADALVVAGQRRGEVLHDVCWRGQGQTVDDGPGGLWFLVRHTADVPETSPLCDLPRRS